MSKLIGCCGFKCFMCAAYVENHQGAEGRKEVADKWKHYFNYEISPDKMDCPGCRASKEASEGMIHGDCEYRNCAMVKGVSHCKECDDYSCEKLSRYHRLYEEAYHTAQGTILQGDEEGYFLTYIPDNEKA